MDKNEPLSVAEYFQRERLRDHAPDLLIALERVVVYIEVAGLIPPCVREARKIIAKAKGGE